MYLKLFWSALVSWKWFMSVNRVFWGRYRGGGPGCGAEGGYCTGVFHRAGVDTVLQTPHSAVQEPAACSTLPQYAHDNPQNQPALPVTVSGSPVSFQRLIFN